MTHGIDVRRDDRGRIILGVAGEDRGRTVCCRVRMILPDLVQLYDDLEAMLADNETNARAYMYEVNADRDYDAAVDAHATGDGPKP